MTHCINRCLLAVLILMYSNVQLLLSAHAKLRVPAVYALDPTNKLIKKIVPSIKAQKISSLDIYVSRLKPILCFLIYLRVLVSNHNSLRLTKFMRTLICNKMSV